MCVSLSFTFQTQKRRYFILWSTLNGTARLEYFENEKRFRLQSSPKRTINLASCFNIGRKDDLKNNFVFALYTRDDVFGLIAESEEEMSSWLKCLWEERNKSENRSDYGENILNYLFKSLFLQAVCIIPRWFAGALTPCCCTKIFSFVLIFIFVYHQHLQMFSRVELFIYL